MNDVNEARRKAHSKVDEKWDVYAEKLYEAMGSPMRGDKLGMMTRKLSRKLEDTDPLS